MQGFDVDGLKTWSRDNMPLARAVCLAKALAKLERERVNAYIRPVFDRFAFVSEDSGAPITDPDRIYLSGDDEQTARYFAACDTAHRDHGFTGPYGHCPALLVDALLVDAENALLASLEDPMSPDRRHGIPYSMRDKALDLALSAALGSEL